MRRIALLLSLTLLTGIWPAYPVRVDAEEAAEETVCEIELPRQPIRVSPLLARLRPGRVLLVRGLDRQDRLKEERTMAERLANHLRRQSLFDVVECKECACNGTTPLRTAQFNERTLVRYAQTYGVDSVLYCTVRSIDAYRPMSIELDFLLVNIDQAIPVASGSVSYNLADPVTQEVFASLSGFQEPHVTSPLSSPTRLIDFATAQLADQLKSLWR